MALGATLLIAIPATNAINPKPIVHEEVAQKTVLNPKIGLLALCESSNNPKAVNLNDAGSPSYGLYQYKKGTWISYMKKYNLAPHAEDAELMNFIYDREMQTLLTQKILEEKNGWKHWYDCSRRVGLNT